MIQDLKNIGKWFRIELDNVVYNVLIQGRDLGSIIVMDENFDKIPYGKWSKFGEIMSMVDFKHDCIDEISVVVLYKNGRPHSFMSEELFDRRKSEGIKMSYDVIHHIEISKYDWNNVSMDNIEEFVRQHEMSGYWSGGYSTIE